MQPSPRLNSSSSEEQTVPLATALTIRLTPFDQYRKLIEARGETIRRVVRKLKPALGLSNAVDVGCGVGFFSQTLVRMRLECLRI
jgi:2-polyprenyl-3-methyl-5-hydroxy-6-metoxy-1,4-benzoquinol methylase